MCTLARMTIVVVMWLLIDNLCGLRALEASMGVQWQFAYDEAGRMTKAVDPAGRQTTLHYALDDNQRVQRTTKTLPDASKVIYTFDRFGQQTSMMDSTGTVRYVYDGFNRLTTVHREGNPALTYTYDTLNRLRSISVGEGWTIHYTYDFLGRLAEIGTPVGNITYEYRHGQGAIVRTLPNGIRTIWAYRPDGNLESITHVTDGNKIMEQFTYAYRPDGLISNTVERSAQGERALTYTYDSMQHLSAATDSRQGTTHYHYDTFGNRTEVRSPSGQTVRSAYDWAARLVQYAGQETIHDAAGNLTAYAHPQGLKTFAHSAMHQMQTATTSAGNVHYQYDGNGALIARAPGTQTAAFVVDPLADIWRPLLATDGQGRQTYYVWEGDVPLVAIADGKAQFLLHDHLGSVRTVTDRTGSIVRRLAYSPFGTPQDVSGTDAVHPGFAGLFFDPHASLYLTRARAYDPGTARFLQRDPLLYRTASSPGNHAAYVYCHGDPVNFVDRDGREERAVTKQPFLDYINGTEAHFQNGLALGVGSGTYSREEIARLADGRFAVVVIWGNAQGPAIDLFRAALWDTAGGARQAPRVMPFSIGEPFVHHSAGNFIAPESVVTSLRLDPAGYGLEQANIFLPGIVSNLTSVDLATPLQSGIPGVAFTGHSPAEALGDAARFVWGLGQLGKRTLAMPFTGQGPFASHALEPMLNDLEEAGLIPPKNTFDIVRLVFAGDDRPPRPDVVMQQRHGQWLPQDPQEQAALLPPVIDRHTSSAWVHQVGADSPGTMQESMVSQSLRSLPGAKRRQIDVYGPTQKAAADLAADVSQRHPDAVVVIQPQGSKQTGGSAGKSTQIGRIKDTGVWTPKIIAYGTTREDAEVIARLASKHRPDAIIVKKWGNASADELAQLRRAEAADRVLVRRSGPGTKLLGDAVHAPAEKAAVPSREAQHIRTRLLSPWGGNGNASSSGSPLTPSPVGGIYLRGASEALKVLGPLTGLSLDKSTGRLVLLSEEKGTIALPPLRLDDVVTVFRSVYAYGEAPFVSIDPSPQNPTGPTMLVRHGQGTANTYVGWVLFEADRIMKAYSLGRDNVSRQPITSKVHNYQHLFDLSFLSDHTASDGGLWERFWIVPATVNRQQTRQHALTLFEVPLKVNTQRMVLHEGKLAPAPAEVSSPGASTFAAWFTGRYKDIAEEVVSQPPEGCGMHAPVAVFTELQRIAVLVAMAEGLRDQGIPLPSWMRDYPVPPCPVAVTTPAMVVEASQTDTQHTATGRVERTRTQRIYGGVSLSPADNAVQTSAAPPQADTLAATMRQAVAAAPELSPAAFQDNGKPYQALALPGENTRALTANRLQETDLVVPVQSGTSISLVRHFHSFFQPAEVFGPAWSLDLPRLVEQHRPVRRPGETMAYTTTYQLTSPLNTLSASFTEPQFVPDINATVLVPEDSRDILGLGSAEDEQIGVPTRVVLFRDGRRWYFDPAGNLVAVKQLPLTVIYRWDGAHRLQRLEGWYGKVLRADIRFAYDSHGRLTRAHSSNGTSVTYTYDMAGMLVRVQGPEGIRDYTYQDGLVTEIVQDGQMVRQFAYNGRGQLQRERHTDGTEMVYQVASGTDGVTVTAQRSDMPHARETVQYDTALRPVHQVFADGTRLQWRYDAHGTTETHMTLPGGERYMISHATDSRQHTWHIPAGGTYRAEYDAAGRVASLWEGDSARLRLQWHQDGQLALATSEAAALHPEYRADGLLAGMLVTTLEKGPRFSHWLRVAYDEQGRAAQVQDYTGSEIRLGYDNTGRVVGLESLRGSMQLQRDAQGRVLTARTSWGARQENTYDPQSGALKKTTLTQEGNTAVIEFDQGRPTRVQQFDGGEFRIAYYDRGFHTGQIQQVRTPNDLVCTYEYDAESRPTVIHCGADYRLEFTYDAHHHLVGFAQVPVRQ